MGAPVIASNVSSIPEITEDAALLIDPYDWESIFRAMKNLVEDPNLRLLIGEKAMHQSAKFSWSSTAARVLQLYQEVTRCEPLTESLRQRDLGHDLRQNWGRPQWKRSVAGMKQGKPEGE